MQSILNPYVVDRCVHTGVLFGLFKSKSPESIDKTAKEEFALFRNKPTEWSQDVILAKKQSNARWICVYYKPNLPLMVCEAIKQPTGLAVTCFTKESPIKQIIVPINNKDVLWKTTAQPAPQRYH